MRQKAVQLTAGLGAIAVVLALYGFSERQRERRHAKRPQDIVDRVIDMARVSSSDTVYDLECGDGGVVVNAAARYGAHGWCFDIYPQRLAEARERARAAGVEHLITFREQFWDTIDVAPATVVVVWLTNPTGHIENYKIRGQLTRELRPGSRIISYRLDMGDWEPTAVSSVPTASNEPAAKVKLWIADGKVRPLLE
jgi:trans-aconitate methyltransferase